MDYKTKYLKYKLKYLTAKKLYGGMDFGAGSDEESFSSETPEKNVPDAPQKQAEITKQLDDIFKTEEDIFERFKKALQILRFNEYNKRAFLQYTLEDIDKDMNHIEEIKNLVSELKTEELFGLPFQRSLVPQVVYEGEEGFTTVEARKKDTKPSSKQTRKHNMQELLEAAKRMGFDIMLNDRDSGELDNSIGHPGDGLYPLYNNEYLQKLSETDLFIQRLGADETAYLNFFKQFYEESLSAYLNYSNKSIIAELRDKLSKGEIKDIDGIDYRSIINYLDKITYEVDVNLEHEENPWEIKMYYNQDAVDSAADDGKDIPEVEPFHTVNVTEKGIKQKAIDYFKSKKPEDSINLPKFVKDKAEKISNKVEQFIRLIISAFLKSYGDESYCYMVLLFYSMFYNIATEEKEVKIFVSTHDKNLQNQLQLFCHPLSLLNKNIKFSLALRNKEYEMSHY